MLPSYFNFTDVTLTKNRSKNKFFSEFINVSVSPVESVLLRYFKVTDVTSTVNKNKNKYYFTKVHNFQYITHGRYAALILQGYRCHINKKQKQKSSFQKFITVSVSQVESVLP